MLAFVDSMLRGGDFSFRGEDAALFRNQIGAALMEFNPSNFNGLVPPRQVPVATQPQSVLFDLNEFNLVGLRRNPLPTIETVALDNSEESEAYERDEICLSEDDSDNPTITDEVPAPIEPEQTRTKTTNRKRISNCGALPDSSLFEKIDKKNWRFGRTVFRPVRMINQALESSIVVATSDNQEIDYGGQNHGSDRTHVRYQCVSCRKINKRQESVIDLLAIIHEPIFNYIYLNKETNILYEYPPTRTHTPGCPFSSVALPPAKIDFFVQLSPEDHLLLTQLTVGLQTYH